LEIYNTKREERGLAVDVSTGNPLMTVELTYP